MKHFSIALLLSLALPSFAEEPRPPPDVKQLNYERVDDALPTITLAQGEVIPAPTTAPPSAFGQLAEQFLSPTGVMAILATLLTIIGSFIGLSVNAKRRVALGSYHAFHVVEDIAAETDTPIDNKAVPYLKALNDYFLANNWRAPKPAEQQQALLLAKELSGEEKSKQKVAAAAIIDAQAKLAANPSSP